MSSQGRTLIGTAFSDSFGEKSGFTFVQGAQESAAWRMWQEKSSDKTGIRNTSQNGLLSSSSLTLSRLPSSTHLRTVARSATASTSQ